VSFRILVTADLHIGRRPSKLRDADDARRFSCARMWEAIVDRAIGEGVDLVALTGDVVDHENRYFEATGPLERGLARLRDAGIPTYAVAGNHDFDVLPRLVEAIGPEHFRLLGAGGHWEEALFEGRDGRRLRIHGWSFPSEHVPTSPLAGYHLAAGRDDTPVLGLLHADLDSPGSVYAPVTRAELLAREEITAWALGHVHAPQFCPAAGGPAILYPGSPQAMDPGETGPHGPWLLEIGGPRTVAAVQWEMSRVRYDNLSVDLSGIAAREQFAQHATDAVRSHLAAIAEGEDPPARLVLRLELTGPTPVCGQVADWAAPLAADFERTAGGVTASIDKVTDNTRPEIDLDELSARRDPPGVLARIVRQLQSGQDDDQVHAILAEAHRKMEEVYRAGPYTRIDDGSPPDRDAARQRLVRQGLRLLEALRAQERTG
jgi:exonuclease SbcD